MLHMLKQKPYASYKLHLISSPQGKKAGTSSTHKI